MNKDVRKLATMNIIPNSIITKNFIDVILHEKNYANSTDANKKLTEGGFIMCDENKILKHLL